MQPRRLLPLLLVIIGLLAYHNGFQGVFVYDDRLAIVKNPTLRQLWPPWAALTPPAATPVAARPVANLSLALNYAISGLDPWSYHAVNLLIHLLNGLLLFGILCRILGAPREGTRPTTDVGPLPPAGVGGTAAIAAGLWLVHPLQTDSVMYVTQRTELLFGFFLLLTLYCVIRATDSGGIESGIFLRRSSRETVRLARWGWPAVAVAACALGMGCKETMVVAPVLVWLYDRIFLGSPPSPLAMHCNHEPTKPPPRSGGGTEPGRAPATRWLGSRKRQFMGRWRPKLYLALAACWLILIAWQLGRPRAGSAGFGFAHLSPLQYALTQCGVIAHYLRLSFWPHPLVIDYEDWPIAQSLADVWPQAAVVAVLLAATAWALRFRPAVGYLGAWFFLILAPTSSVLPIAAELAAERRMYLPLAAVIVGVILLVRPLKGWRALLLVVAGVLTILTIQRNRQYHREVAILESTVAARPHNARARTNLGNAWLRQNDPARALTQYAAATQLQPRRAEAHNNLGVALAALGERDHALAHYREAARLDSQLLDARFNLGLALMEQGKFAEAIPHLEAALEMQPDLSAARVALDKARASVTLRPTAP